MGPKHDTIWIREWSDGDWEMGVLEREHYGWVMVVDRFCYFWNLKLSDWKYAGYL
jgi:hypothetical protein